MSGLSITKLTCDSHFVIRISVLVKRALLVRLINECENLLRKALFCVYAYFGCTVNSEIK